MDSIMPCPNPECRSECKLFSWDICTLPASWYVKCKKCNYQGPQVEDAGDEEGKSAQEAIRLHNLLCRPAPETQVVAVESPLLTFAVAFLDGWLEDAPEEAKRNWRRIKERVRSPVESAPALSPFEKLAEEWRLHPRRHLMSDTEAHVYFSALLECADRLSAVVEEVRGK